MLVFLSQCRASIYLSQGLQLLVINHCNNEDQIELSSAMIKDQRRFFFFFNKPNPVFLCQKWFRLSWLAKWRRKTEDFFNKAAKQGEIQEWPSVFVGGGG